MSLGSDRMKQSIQHINIPLLQFDINIHFHFYLIGHLYICINVYYNVSEIECISLSLSLSLSLSQYIIYVHFRSVNTTIILISNSRLACVLTRLLFSVILMSFNKWIIIEYAYIVSINIIPIIDSDLTVQYPHTQWLNHAFYNRCFPGNNTNVITHGTYYDLSK
jgi:hypothetical protein